MIRSESDTSLVRARGNVKLLRMLRKDIKRIISMTYPLAPFKAANRLIQIPLCSLFIIWNFSRFKDPVYIKLPRSLSGPPSSSGSN